ncbi:MAG TPA: protein kinase [Pyrinomonadaceae bacterium]|nr:protein kinase [Pyrinomonadaceae bacterium]
MNPARWQQLETIYHAALDQPPDTRLAFLREKCAGDADLYSELESLISSQDQFDSFLEDSGFDLALRVLARPAPVLEIDQQFGNYKIIGTVGRGGMGEVYLAEDERLRRKVALKLLPAELLESVHFRSRFELEARAAAAVSHPNIAHIYEIGEIENLSYIAMEYVEGKTLREVLREAGRLPEQEAVKITIQIAEALETAHQAGIVHRDIKPENIMLRPDGYVKVLDFGLAKLGEVAQFFAEKEENFFAENQTEHGLILGTVRYMSPEQARGDEVDARSDVWSLGVVLYEILAGESPFKGENKGEIIARILSDEPVLFTAANRSFSPALEKILRRALAKNAAERFATAEEFRAELHTALNNQTNSQNPAVSANRTKWILPMVAILLTAAVVSALYLQTKQAPVQAPTTNAPKLQAKNIEATERAVCAAISSDGGRLAYAAEADGGQAIFIRDLKNGETRQILPPAAANDFAGACLTFSTGGDFIYYGVYENDSLEGKLYRISAEGGEPQFLIRKIDSPVSFSPDGRQMVFLVTEKNEEKLVIANADGSQPRIILTRADPLFLSGECYPAWSPDGRTIAFAEGISAGQRQMSLALYHLENGRTHNLATPPFYEIKQFAWDANAALIFTARREGETQNQLYRADSSSGETKRLFEDLVDYAGVSIARGEGKFVSVAAEDAAQIWTLEVGENDSAKQISAGKHDGQGISWLTQDSLVFGSNAGGSWDLWSTRADGSERRQLMNDAAFDTDPAASSDGSFVVFSSTRSGVYNLWRLNLVDNSLTQLTSGTGEYYPRITPDNQWTVFHRVGTGEPVAVWKVATGGGSPVQLTVKSSSRASVSPDGSLIASTYREKDENPSFSIGIYSINGAEKGVRLLKPAAGARLFVPLRWSPDGKAVVYVVGKGGADNLWIHPIDEKLPPRQLTDFTSDRIYSFDFSPDGKRLALARGRRSSRVVLFEGLK